jgi:hypothetical protein
VSLGVVLGVLTLAIVASLIFRPKPKPEGLPPRELEVKPAGAPQAGPEAAPETKPAP